MAIPKCTIYVGKIIVFLHVVLTYMCITDIDYMLAHLRCHICLDVHITFIYVNGLTYMYHNK